MVTYILQVNSLTIRIFLLGCLTAFACSCVNTKKYSNVWIYKGQKYFVRVPHALPPRTDTLYYKELTSGVKAKIKLPEGASRERLDIVFLERMENKEKIDSFKLPDAQNQNGTFFPLETTRTFKEEERGVLSSDKFRYLEIRPVFQAMSIPVKVRFKLNDSTKSAASSSFNVGIAYGAKFTHTVYRKLYYKDSSKLNFLNHNFRKISFSPGIFLGPTVVDLKATNTYSAVKKDRSTLGLTYGGFLVVGYNEFNLGIAFGVDKVFGTQEKNWMYNGKMWMGFVFAIDLVK